MFAWNWKKKIKIFCKPDTWNENRLKLPLTIPKIENKAEKKN